MTENKRWYAIHTKARAERLVQRQLVHAGFEVLYLHYRATVSHARRKIAVLKPYFPRYVFVGVTERHHLGQASKMLGVSTLVYAGNKPLEIPAPVMAELAERGDQNGLVGLSRDELAAREAYRVGDTVRIASGPLVGLLAEIEIDKGQEVVVWLNLFKGQVQASLSPEAVSPALRSSGQFA